MTVLSVKLFSRPNCMPRKAGRDIYTWHLGGPPSRQHGVQTGWPWKGWWSTMHFRTAEWEEKLLAWHLTTVSMNKTHSTFETSLLKVSLCICAQRHKTTGLQHFWQSSKKPFNLPASTGTHHCEGTRLCFYCKPTVPLWGLQPTKVVVIEVLPVLFAHECEGKESPLG